MLFSLLSSEKTPTCLQLLFQKVEVRVNKTLSRFVITCLPLSYATESGDVSERESWFTSLQAAHPTVKTQRWVPRAGKGNDCDLQVPTNTADTPHSAAGRCVRVRVRVCVGACVWVYAFVFAGACACMSLRM